MQPAPISRNPLGIFNRSVDEGANQAVQRALKKIRCWRTPGNWSGRDWVDEVRAIAATAAWQAEMDYDPKRRIPLAAFAYRRAITSAWTRYRQEWAYCRHFVPDAANSRGLVAATPETRDREENLNGEVGRALSQLSFQEQWLIRQLFWSGATEGRLATTLRISQQAVNRRKRRALKHLRCFLDRTQQRHLRCKLFVVSAFLA